VENLLAFIAAAFAAFAPMQHGVASIYDERHSITACGDHFDRGALTAAHRTLPCGARVRVWRGARSVVVKINDRGPWHGGRIIDLTPAAAAALGFDDRAGLATVSLERLD
jgi:rare lipoprotein A